VSADIGRGPWAVCEEVAGAMAEGALWRAPADLCLAVTGVAGAGPDPDGKPIGGGSQRCKEMGRTAV
jgi:nicotinamide-nucleotide amidase